MVLITSDGLRTEEQLIEEERERTWDVVCTCGAPLPYISPESSHVCTSCNTTWTGDPLLPDWLNVVWRGSFP